MPWREVVTVELRQQFVQDALRRVVPVTELCRAYGISRKTGYKFLRRYHALGAVGLTDQSRRPHRSPTALDPPLLQRLLEAHERHPYWGPRKLLRLVGQRWPEAPWPALLDPAGMDASMRGSPRALTCASRTARRTPWMLIRSYSRVTVVRSATMR